MADRPPACRHADAGELDKLRTMSATALLEADKYGGQAVHWAAGSGHGATLAWLLSAEGGHHGDSEGINSTSRSSKRRRPLHYAARNGHLDVVRYLCEEQRVDVDARDSQGVSPFQLAVWQNHLDVARYLVEEHGVDVAQTNAFACGPQHWLGTAPRSCGDVLPMARWLQRRGVDMHAEQRQGHRPLHKAAWGGRLELCRWLRDE